MVGLCAGDLAHGIVEGQAEDLDMEVNGVAGEVASYGFNSHRISSQIGALWS